MERANISMVDVEVFYNLITEVTSYHFCHIHYKQVTRPNPHSGKGMTTGK